MGQGDKTTAQKISGRLIWGYIYRYTPPRSYAPGGHVSLKVLTLMISSPLSAGTECTEIICWWCATGRDYDIPQTP